MKKYDDAANFDYIYDGKSTVIMGCFDTDSLEIRIPPVVEGAPVGGIGSGAFKGLSHLRYISIPETVTSIENAAFRGCAGLKSIVLPRYLDSIGAYAFAECIGLRKITMPNTVSRIDVNSFTGCDALSEVVILDRDTGAKKSFVIGGRVDLSRYFYINACMRAADKSGAYMDKYDAAFLEVVDEYDLFSVAAFRLSDPHDLTERMREIYRNAIMGTILNLIKADNVEFLATAGRLECIDISQIDHYIEIAGRNGGHCTAYLLDYKNKYGKRRQRSFAL